MLARARSGLKRTDFTISSVRSSVKMIAAKNENIVNPSVLGLGGGSGTGRFQLTREYPPPSVYLATLREDVVED